MRTPSLLSLLALTAGALAQAPDAAVVKEVSPGIYEVGKVRLEQEAHRITFPAAVNMDSGVLEYALVSKDGPTHESLLVTDTSPSDLHLAMLLLGAKNNPSEPGKQPLPPPQITGDYLKHAPDITGEQIVLTLSWKDKSGAEKSGPLEDWLFQLDTKKPAPHGPWTYNGSMFSSNGKFMAQQEGAFVALVTNPAALINNPRKGHDDDQIWTVLEKTVPPRDTPVQVQLTFAPK